MTTGRHLVHDSLYEEYVERLAAKADSLAVGDPQPGAGPPGPDHRRQPARQGARSGRGQHRPGRQAGRGRHARQAASTVRRSSPTSTTATPAYAEEVFGPVAPVRSFRTPDEAAALAGGRSLRPRARHRHPGPGPRPRPRRTDPDRHRPHQRPDRERRGGGAPSAASPRPAPAPASAARPTWRRSRRRAGRPYARTWRRTRSEAVLKSRTRPTSGCGRRPTRRSARPVPAARRRTCGPRPCPDCGPAR